MLLNTIKTGFLLAMLSGLFLMVGSLLGGTSGMHMALIMSLLMNGITFFFSDKIVLKMYGAKPLDKKTYGAIYQTVSELAHTMNIPMPKLWLIQTPMANAFATGRGPANGSIALTSSIISLLNPNELRGVLAHEMSHIKNRDILIGTIAATFATAIGYLAYTLRYAALWGSMGRRNDQNRNGISAFMAIIIAMLMPIAASLIQLALSRSREYLADETGACESQDPLSLASALEKLHSGIPHSQEESACDSRHAATASLFIVNPFTSNGWMSLFMTHPPVHLRIQRLRAMNKKSSSH